MTFATMGYMYFYGIYIYGIYIYKALKFLCFDCKKYMKMQVYIKEKCKMCKKEFSTIIY
jgi:hypothetical protein